MVKMIDICADFDPEEGNGKFLRNVDICFAILIRRYTQKAKIKVGISRKAI
jgi:hypothetical protein